MEHEWDEQPLAGHLRHGQWQLLDQWLCEPGQFHCHNDHYELRGCRWSDEHSVPVLSRLVTVMKVSKFGEQHDNQRSRTEMKGIKANNKCLRSRLGEHPVAALLICSVNLL